jgi:hypothetical protein
VSFLIRLPPDVSVAEQRARFRDYRHYLDAQRKRMPVRAWEFAAAEWHYNPDDHRCPHDAWVNRLEVVELAGGDRHQNRTLEIRVELLGAYHDGRIRLVYPGVTRYSFYLPWDPRSGAPAAGHGDWLVDEVSRSDSSRADRLVVLHEVAFANGSVWTIESDDIHYDWLPDEPLSSAG